MEWINIKTQKPTKNDPIIITDGSTSYYGVFYPFDGYEFQISEDWNWEEESFGLNAIKEIAVTHWMPLPEPPKQ